MSAIKSEDLSDILSTSPTKHKIIPKDTQKTFKMTTIQQEEEESPVYRFRTSPSPSVIFKEPKPEKVTKTSVNTAQLLRAIGLKSI